MDKEEGVGGGRRVERHRRGRVEKGEGEADGAEHDDGPRWGIVNVTMGK